MKIGNSTVVSLLDRRAHGIGDQRPDDVVERAGARRFYLP